MSTVRNEDTIKKVYDNCGAILKGLINDEFFNGQLVNIKTLDDERKIHKEVVNNLQYFLDGAQQGNNYRYRKMVHGSKPEQLENTALRLWILGIKKGNHKLDASIETYVEIMRRDLYAKKEMRSYGIFNIAQMLSLIGYFEMDEINKALRIRLNQLYSFVIKERFDIYKSAKEFKGIPSNWKDQTKFVDPELTKYGGIEGTPPLPSQYDMLGFMGMKGRVSLIDAKKIETVVSYCLNSKYQNGVEPGYGILMTPTRRYYSMGWSVHVPCYGQKITPDDDIRRILLWSYILTFLCNDKAKQQFGNVLEFLEGYRLDNGFYKLPKEFIPNTKSGYFISGKNLSVGENRKNRGALIWESTYWVMRLKKNLGVY